MEEVRIGSRGDSLGLAVDEYAGSITVRVESRRLCAETRPRDRYDLHGLAAYLTDLSETAMDGWEGARAWESLEGDVGLEASLRNGRVNITATLRSERVTAGNGGWSVRLDITVDPGEELRQCASSTKRLIGSG